MKSNNNVFIEFIKSSIKENTFIKISLGNYKGNDTELKKILIKPILIKGKYRLSFTFRYKTKDQVHNYSEDKSIELLLSYINPNDFNIITLFTIEYDYIFEYSKNGKSTIRKNNPSSQSLPSLQHDNQKHRKIGIEGKQYLFDLGLLDKNGNVYKKAQNKYKQINHYIELLSTLLKDLPKKQMTNVVDMGAGKGYLTFALYDYMVNEMQKPSTVIGVEYRKDLVELCNSIATKSSFNNLKFEQGSIENYNNPNIDVLIALHACDTATDDAIYKGIKNNAELIVVAPCCHKQIRREIEKCTVNNELDFLTRHGIFLERQAEMITDGIRSLILEYYGYKTKVFEFISDAHTPKNILIVGSKKKKVSEERKAKILKEIKQSKAFFGIDSHHLEKLLLINKV